MTGCNTIEMNQATMKKAVQHYFDSVLFAEGQSPTVANITAEQSYGTYHFQVGTNDNIPESSS